MQDLSPQYRAWRERQVASSPRKVLVLGAGLAGLCSAWELRKLGHSVRILEARKRPGGRVLTLREPFSDGLYAEAGALFIPESHELTVAYSKLFGLPLQPLTRAENAFPHYYIEGRLIKNATATNALWPVQLAESEKNAGIIGMNNQFINPVLKQLGDPRAPDWPTPGLEKFDRISFYDFLLEQGASPGAITLLRSGYYDLWGDGVEACSALTILRDSAMTTDDPDEFSPLTAWHRSHANSLQTYTIQGGNDRLPGAFAQHLADAIIYESPVESIRQGSHGVRVTCGSKTYRADFVICTIPFSVLRHVRIKPPFEENKARAVKELEYTSVTRTFLQTSQRFWKQQSMSGVCATDLPLMWVSEASFGQPGQRGILESYCTGARARAVTAMQPATRIESTLRLFEQVYPDIANYFEPAHVAIKCWDEDPWMRGDYCWFKPGQVFQLLPHVATPSGRIHFAGDHASALPGWMQGAFESALRATSEVNAAT